MEPYRLGICFALLVVFLLAAAPVKATSVSASFSTVNSTIGINEYEFFNVTSYFPSNSTYQLFLNNVSVAAGTLRANTANWTIIKYNVTDTPYGNYVPCIKFSSLTSQLCSTQFSITSSSGFGFLGYSPYTYVYNGSSKLDIVVINTGNTNLNFNWVLPTVNSVLFSLVYKQSFDLVPGGVYSIPINISAGKSAQGTLLNFSFYAYFDGSTLRKSYLVTLFVPFINISFYGERQINNQTANRTFFTTGVRNTDNTNLNLTLQFLLDLDGNEFLFNRSYEVSPSTTNITVALPASTILSARAFYTASNGSVISPQIFSQAAPTPFGVTNVTDDILYAAITAAMIGLAAIIHYRLKKK